MRAHISPMFVVLAMMVLGGCTKMIEVHVISQDGQLVIDPAHHDTAYVKPGDRIVWSCPSCPRGTQFTVADLRYVGDLDEILELFLPHGADIGEPEKLLKEINTIQEGVTIQQTEWLSGNVSSEATEAPDAIDSSSGGVEAQVPSVNRVRQGPLIDALIDALSEHVERRSGLYPREQRELFRGGWEPKGEFVDFDKQIRSPPVAKGIGHGVWVFEWKVQLENKPDSEVGSSETRWLEYDPHIVGYEDMEQ